MIQRQASGDAKEPGPPFVPGRRGIGAQGADGHFLGDSMADDQPCDIGEQFGTSRLEESREIAGDHPRILLWGKAA